MEEIVKQDKEVSYLKSSLQRFSDGKKNLNMILDQCKIPTFPESLSLQEKILKSSKASKASHTDPKQPF
uniref:Uncharacterized protein n=1 Tax=Oryza sativa subsp. japonica TaxID=39947 RepID=Q6K262_ORYSJ|nr:hypothetical protein [Oryza sativa Japonica Group]BAD26119.1 hypothetical protein [Oryza sativa Japonica Group]